MLAMTIILGSARRNLRRRFQVLPDEVGDGLDGVEFDVTVHEQRVAGGRPLVPARRIIRKDDHGIGKENSPGRGGDGGGFDRVPAAGDIRRQARGIERRSRVHLRLPSQ